MLLSAGVRIYYFSTLTDVIMDQSTIESIIVHNKDGFVSLSARCFADCTGDGNLGFLAGADWRMGREGRRETGESKAPEEADNRVLGSTLHWRAAATGKSPTFPDCPWAVPFSKNTCMFALSGAWNWEAGYDNNMIDEAEMVRDYLFRVIYGNWSYQKKNHDNYRAYEIVWMGHVLGKRESRRLLGDVIVTEQDVLTNRKFPDACVPTFWGIDLHGPHPNNTKHFPGQEFLAHADHANRGNQPFVVPYRSLYSRNIENLFVAGRCISVTHVAHGQTRVIRNTGTMGEAVGLAAVVCRAKGCTPCKVYPEYWNDLTTLFEGQ